MKWSLIFIGLLAVCSAADKKEETKDSKDKRQVKHTRVLPHQYPSQQDQFIIRSVGPSQHSPGPRGSPQQEQAEETAPEGYAYLQEISQGPPQKNVQYGKAPPGKGYAVGPQYFPEAQEQSGPYRGEQQVQFIPEEQILKILQEELAARGISDLDAKSLPAPYQAPGVSKYRESAPAPTQEPVQYIPQNFQQHQFYNQHPLDYHRSVPNHPLAKSSLEKELEKLIASNKPSNSGFRQEAYKAPKQEQKSYVAPSQSPPRALPSPSSPPKQYAYLNDAGQFENFKHGALIFDAQYGQQEPQLFFQQGYKDQGYKDQGYQQGPKLSKPSPTTAQYLTEVPQKPQNKKPNHTPFRPKAQFFIAEEKQPEPEPTSSPSINQGKNAAMKIIEAPDLQYERQPPQASPAVQQYYKQQNFARQEYAQREPSTSSIFVAQGTGLQPGAEAVIPVKQYKPNQNDKIVSLPPQDGRPLTQEEFQQLVDAGYPVQAVPVPVPVPLDKYLKDHPEYYQEEAARQQAHNQQQQQQQAQKIYRPQSKSLPDQRLKVTYLRPLNHPNAKGQS